MKKPLGAALLALLLVAACGSVGGSRLNPLNWFGGSQRVETMAAAPVEGEDPRPLVAQVLSMEVEQVSGGAIVRATGLPPTQGWWEAELVAQPVEDGRLTFRFVVLPPLEARRVSTQPSREVTAGAFLSNQTLDGIREISVTGATNARSSRR